MPKKEKTQQATSYVVGAPLADFQTAPTGFYFKIINCDYCNTQMVISIKQLAEMKAINKRTTEKMKCICIDCLAKKVAEQKDQDFHAVDLATGKSFKLND